MITRLHRGRALFLLAALVVSPRVQAEQERPRYEFRQGSFDGTGKWFEGREIAHFMTHQGAPWLEREEREDEEQPSRLVEALGLKPGDVVADIGAGSGYLSWRMARKVAPGGLVYAEDIQPEMLAILRTNVTAHGVTNVLPVHGDVFGPKLPPATLDLAIFVDVYHECDHPFEIIEAVVASLKPGGRLVFVEYRGEDPQVPIKPLHKMTTAQVRREMDLHALEWVAADERLPRQHILIFRKRSPPR